MGWGMLGKIGAIAGAPFTGGASLALLPMLEGIGQVAGSAGKGAAADRQNQNQLIASQNATKGNMYGTQQNAILNLLQQLEQSKLNRTQIGIQAPRARTGQAMMGSILANLQPTQFSGLPSSVKIPQVSGGLINALGPGARQAGGALEQQAIQALLSGSDMPAPMETEGALLPPPELQGPKQPGMLESILGGVGLGGSFLGAINRARQPQQPRFPYESGGGG